MGTVLVTGSSGKIGSPVVAALRHRGDDVRSFDLVDGDDLRDPVAVAAAVDGCDAVVHAGVLPQKRDGEVATMAATNIDGTRHVLDAAERAGVARVVFFSSNWVFGFLDDGRDPDYLPVDDEHPRRASLPYGMSKVAGEDLCAAWSERTGRPTVALRPVRVVDDREMAALPPDWAERPWVHVDDVVGAVLAALDRDVPLHTRALLSASGPYDTSVAQHVLGWTPVHRWRNRPVRRGLGRAYRGVRRRLVRR